MDIGERIEQRREELGLSQEEPAKIIAFAKVSEATPAYLMGWSNATDGTEYFPQ